MANKHILRGHETRCRHTDQFTKKRITPKQERFCQEYVIDLNATQAAIRTGYSPKTAQEQSSRLLSNVMVQQRIAELSRKITERNEITVDYILNDLRDICNAPADGNLVRTSDRIKAFELLGKYKSLWTEKHDLSHTGTVKLIKLADLRTNN